MLPSHSRTRPTAPSPRYYALLHYGDACPPQIHERRAASAFYDSDDTRAHSRMARTTARPARGDTRSPRDDAHANFSPKKPKLYETDRSGSPFATTMLYG